MKLISSLVVSTALFLVSAPTDSSKCEVQGLTLSRAWLGSGNYSRHVRLIEKSEPLSPEEKYNVNNTYDLIVHIVYADRFFASADRFQYATMRNVLYMLTNGIETSPKTAQNDVPFRSGATGARVLKLELRPSFMSQYHESGHKHDPAFVVYGGSVDNEPPFHYKTVVQHMKIKHIKDQVRTKNGAVVLTHNKWLGSPCTFFVSNLNVPVGLEGVVITNYELLAGIECIVRLLKHAGSAERFREIVETLNNDTRTKLAAETLPQEHE